MNEHATNPIDSPQGNVRPSVKSRIFIVDDHAMFREGLRYLIDREPDFTVCGDTADADEALRNIEELKPDLVIADISLTGTTGIDLIKAIKSKYEDLPVLVVSMHEESLYAERALRAGAAGYVMKQEPAKTVKLAIRKVLSGGIYLNEKTASAVLARLTSRPQAATDSISDLLADRELEVFEMTGRGLSTREIAAQLCIDAKTVDTYRARIKEKLNLKSSSELLKLAIRWNKDNT